MKYYLFHNTNGTFYIRITSFRSFHFRSGRTENSEIHTWLVFCGLDEYTRDMAITFDDEKEARKYYKYFAKPDRQFISTVRENEIPLYIAEQKLKHI